MGGSASYIYYFHELRGYTLHVLLGCSAGVLYWRMLQGHAHRVSQYGFLAVLILLLYSHPVGQVWFAVLGSFHVLFERRNPQWKPILFLFVIASVPYLPWIAIMFRRVSEVSASSLGLDPLSIIGAAAATYSNWLTLGVAALCVLTLRWLREPFIQFLWWWFAGILLLALLVDRFVSYSFHIRQLMAVFPALMLLAVVGLFELNRFRWIQIAVCALWLFMGVYLSFTPGLCKSSLAHYP
jgi:hypothetical protein